MQQKSELPEGWTWTTVERLAFVTKLAGFEFTKYVEYKELGEVPVIKAQNVTKNGFSEGNFVYIDRETMENLPRSRLYGGEVLLVFVGSLGNVGIVPEGKEFFLGPNVAKIKIDERVSNNKFIKYYLQSELGRFFIFNFSKSTTQSSISMKNIRDILVPLPSLPEQHRIVSAIEALFARLDATNEKLDRVQEILKKFRGSVLAAACDGRLAEGWRTENQDIESAASLFDNVREEFKKAKQSKSLEPNPEFNCNEIPEKWLLTSLDKITSKITSGSRAWKPYYCDNGPGTFILSQNVRPLKLDLSYKFGVNPPEGDPDRKRSEVINGDILITIAGNTGDVCRVQSDLSQHYVCQSVALVRPVLKELSPFLELYLNSPLHGQLQYKKWVYGDGRPHLKIDHLKATAILLPPLPEQHEIVRRVDALFAFADSIEAKVAAVREKTEKLRQSILAKTFSGKLVETEAEIARREGRDYETAEVLIEKIKAEKKKSKKK